MITNSRKNYNLGERN